MARLLLIDDEVDFADPLRESLTRRGHEARWLDTPEGALRLLGTGEPFDLILLDNKMPRMSGLDFLAAASRLGSHPPIVLMTSAHSDATVFQAVNLGAFAYVIKPLDIEDMLCELDPIIQEALEITRRPAPVPLPQTSAEPAEPSILVGRSKPLRDLIWRIARLARLDQTVLILGETGTGKDLVARALHTNSRRCDKPFVVMNCTAFNDQLLDDELFGHLPGAFTGAVKLRKGRFEHASGGTLFLDEVGDMPLTLQAKLLRVLENREVTRIGDNDPIKIDVRLLAATHRNLPALVREGKFREDLYHRLEEGIIHVPPLRERRDDVELLARTFLARLVAETGSCPSLHPQAVQRRRDHPWPGNVRQLQKVVCRAAAACRGGAILPADIDFGELGKDEPPTKAVPAFDPHATLRRVVEAAWEGGQPELWPLLQDWLQRELLACAVAHPDLSQVQLAARLGMSRNYLRSRLDHFGFTSPPADTSAAPDRAVNNPCASRDRAVNNPVLAAHQLVALASWSV